ncbi:hypothetical protein, partial [Raoultella planticola]|uniref:hypothetical protein n=2 Tax=Bacteria TaxID=2 RepID=UPI001CE323B0
DVDYATLSNVKVVNSEKKGYQKITADVTIHLHMTDGTVKTRTYPTSSIPESTNTAISNEDKQAALHAEFMNQPLPPDDGSVKK